MLTSREEDRLLLQKNITDQIFFRTLRNARRTALITKYPADFFFSPLPFPPEKSAFWDPNASDRLTIYVRREWKRRSARVALFKWHVLAIPVTNKVIDPIAIATKPR